MVVVLAVASPSNDNTATLSPRVRPTAHELDPDSEPPRCSTRWYRSRSAPSSESWRSAARNNGLAEDEWRHAIGPYLREELAGGDYPHLQEGVVDGAGPDHTERFAFGVDPVLDGLGAWLATVRGQSAGARPDQFGTGAGPERAAVGPKKLLR